MTGFKEEIAQSQPQRLTIGVTPVMLITVLQSCMHHIILCHGHTQALWGEYPTRAVMPVRIRPAQRVCATCSNHDDLPIINREQ
jgi:hypothetical protein